MAMAAEVAVLWWGVRGAVWYAAGGDDAGSDDGVLVRVTRVACWVLWLSVWTGVCGCRWWPEAGEGACVRRRGGRPWVLRAPCVLVRMVGTASNPRCSFAGTTRSTPCALMNCPHWILTTTL